MYNYKNLDIYTNKEPNKKFTQYSGRTTKRVVITQFIVEIVTK